MPSDAAQQNLQDAYDQMAERLVELTASKHPTISIDGVTYSLNEYRAGLIRDMAELRKEIVKAAGPWEIRSRNV